MVERAQQSPTTIQLAHGGGGRLSDRLLERIRQSFEDPELSRCHDGAHLSMSGPLAFTTDSYVVHPYFFPGGDIGRLAVFGTANDLAMCGARAQYLSCALVLEEGLPWADFERILESMDEAAREANIRIVTGDTKVVERGKGDGVYINTSGVGKVISPARIGPDRIEVGDRILLSGDIGRHGMAVMACREGLSFDNPLESDAALLWPQVEGLISTAHCLRDLTRGGLYSNLLELADVSQKTLIVEEDAIAVHEQVRGACHVLGLDPGFSACEGRFVALVSEGAHKDALEQLGPESRCVGRVEDKGGKVLLEGSLGVPRRLQKLSGEQLPRIC